MRARAGSGAIAAILGLMAAMPVMAQGTPLKVVATFSVLGDIVKNVGGDKVSVTVLVGPDADTHTYQPTPGDAKAIAEAKVLVTNGLGLEGWLDRLRGAAQSSAKLVVATTGIKPLTMEDEG